MINKKNFIPTVCIVFTIISLGKVIVEGVTGQKDPYYVSNILFGFFISLCATFILSLHRFLINVPLLFVIIGQYMLVIALAFLVVYIGSFWEPVNSGGYFDIFISVTIPYVIGAVIYYISYFQNLKQANEILKEIQK